MTTINTPDNLAIPVGAMNVIPTGTLLFCTVTNSVFKVLCNCPGSKPEMYTKRYIRNNLQYFRYPTVDEVQAYFSEPQPKT